MVLTRSQLLRAVPELNKAAIDSYVASFNQFAIPYGIDTPLRVIHYLSQTIFESQYLKRTEENLNYSAEGLLKTFPRYFNSQNAKEYARQPEKIANRVYANRYGNGNEASGDGWRYKGRGYIQLTFRSNYEAFNKSDVCTEDVIKKPELVAKFPLAQVSSMWYWETHNLNALADMDDCEAITKAINGGYSHLSDRKFLVRRFKREFGVK